MSWIYDNNMDEFIKADIFFVIASIAVVLVSVLVAVALVYVIRIVRNVNDISRRAKTESYALAQDFAALRAALRSDGSRIKHLFRFFRNMRVQARTRKKSPPSKVSS